MIGRSLDCGRLRQALRDGVLAIDLRVERVVASIDVEGGVRRMRVLVRQAGVVVDERIAPVDADDAEGSRRIRAAALGKADVVAGRSWRIRCWAGLTAQERGGRGQDGGSRE